MKRAGVWVGRALRVLGLVAVIVAIYQGSPWAIVAALGGFFVTFGLTVAPLVRLWRSERPQAHPSDFTHALDLLRRAHGARCAWAVGLEEGGVEVPVEAEPGERAGESAEAAARQRGSALAQLASVDGRTHVSREDAGTYVAVGDFPYGAGVLLPQPDAKSAAAEAAAADLRRLVAGMRLAELELPHGQVQLVARQLAAIAGGAQTVDGLAKAGAELAQQLCQRAAVIVLSDRVSGTVRVVAVSTAADKRLTGLTLAGTAAAARAVQTGLPVAARGGEDVFGPGVPERRRQDREGTAYPLVDGHFPVGALVLLGSPLAPDDPKTEQVGRLVVELGPRLVAALAVHEAEQRAVRDPLTGLVNRREFERQLDTFRQSGGEGGAAATLIYVDLDHFKKLNDTLGHAAGDAALRHVATILSAQIRDGDIVARIGGEEFAVWLPRTDLPEGAEIAERVRRAVEGTAWHWNGTPYPLSASCGVATFPDPVRDVNNLRTTADAALYRAKQEGRNRVAIAGAEG